MDEFKLSEEIEEAIKNGPTFGQSRFQTSNFVVAKHGMDGRSYRQVLLELNAKFTALKKCKISVKRIGIQCLALEEKIEQTKDINERNLLICDLEEKQIDMKQQEKLVLDAMSECNFLYASFKEMPKVTAEEFEAQERAYWEKRLILDAELSVLATGRIDIGTAMSLANIGHNPLQIQTDIALQQFDSIKQIEEQRHLLLEEKSSKDKRGT